MYGPCPQLLTHFCARRHANAFYIRRQLFGSFQFSMTDIFFNFFEFIVLDALISWNCDVNYEASLFLVADQRDVRPIGEQMFDGLDREDSDNF